MCRPMLVSLPVVAWFLLSEGAASRGEPRGKVDRDGMKGGREGSSLTVRDGGIREGSSSRESGYRGLGRLRAAHLHEVSVAAAQGDSVEPYHHHRPLAQQLAGWMCLSEVDGRGTLYRCCIIIFPNADLSV